MVLAEVPEEVHKPRLHQQIRKLLTARVLGLSNVGVEIPYKYEILVPETGPSLLHIREVLQGGGGGGTI